MMRKLGVGAKCSFKFNNKVESQKVSQQHYLALSYVQLIFVNPCTQYDHSTLNNRRMFSLQQRFDHYKLTVRGVDMGGASNGRTGEGTVEIKVLDINDNRPDLEKSEVRIIAYTVGLHTHTHTHTLWCSQTADAVSVQL